MAIAWVAVGVFAAVFSGQPDISTAASEIFKTEAECIERLEVIKKNVAQHQNSADATLVAYGASCVKVEVKELPKKDAL